MTAPQQRRAALNVGGERSDYMGGDGLAAADGVDTLVGFGLQVDCFRSNTERFGQDFAHLREMRTELGFFHDHHGVDVIDPKALIVQQFAGMFEEQQAVGALPSGIRVGKVPTDVAEPGSSEQSVAQGVRQNIAIGVARWTFVKG